MARRKMTSRKQLSFDPNARSYPHDTSYLDGGRVWYWVVRAGSIICGLAVLSLVALLVTNYWSLIYSLFTVPGYLMGSVTEPTFYLLVPFPGILMPVYMGTGGMEAVIYYFFLAVILLLAIGIMIKKEGRHFLSIASLAIRRKKAPPADVNNSFIMLFQLFMALLFVNMIIITVHTLLTGNSPSVPESLGESTVIEKRLYMLANASVYEEIVTRILLLGLPLYFVAILTKKKDRTWYKYLLGGNIKIGFGAFFFALFSASLFGIAHLSWGAWKVIPTVISGLAFSYIFLKKGVFPAIVFHFLFDYLGMGGSIIEHSGYSATGYNILFSILLLLWLHAGIRYFTHYTLRSVFFAYNAFMKFFKKSARQLRIKLRTEAVLSLLILLIFWYLFYLNLNENINTSGGRGTIAYLFRMFIGL
ncbi:MAG: CPBP family glutamic-type intramembrane protease [Candidatus Thermoplasmatota archaeon]|nr:CPBP family glutamic-type intramembrane protease [Candidatus Thermoplasmatota archaeon]MDP7423731.1 CPBP family glutamic-type intramembrane protease [bacterium]